MKDNFFIGLMLGVVFSALFNVFLVWGGNPRGMFWRIDDNKKVIVNIDENVSTNINKINLEIQKLRKDFESRPIHFKK